MGDLRAKQESCSASAGFRKYVTDPVVCDSSKGVNSSSKGVNPMSNGLGLSGQHPFLPWVSVSLLSSPCSRQNKLEQKLRAPLGSEAKSKAQK